MQGMRGLTMTRDVLTFDIDLDDANASGEVIDVRGASKMTTQIVNLTGTKTTAVITAQKSIDGRNFEDFSPSYSITTDGYSGTQDLIGVAYVRLQVTTAEGSASLARVFVALEPIT